MTNEEKKLVDSMFWWHKIRLTEDYTTPGICSHGNEFDFESRFGLPKRLDGLNVLDIGGWDGLFSFEAEARGANKITMIDIYQRRLDEYNNIMEGNKPFQLAKKVLNSKVVFKPDSLESLDKDLIFVPDYIFYFGVLYHIKNPLGAVEKLALLSAPGTIILLETTVTNINIDKPILEYRPGFEEDPTNQFYPNKQWITEAFIQHGAKSVEQIWTDNIRSSFKIIF